MKRTIVSHFYNEEWLLPFWLKHHREIFDHGIMINYRSTDRSVEIIKELCPTWEIRDTTNVNFQSPHSIDEEVMSIESTIEGWRTTLNTTEFLIGNYDEYMVDVQDHRHFLAQTYSFVDMERRDELFYLTYDLPLHKQRWWGVGGNNAQWELFRTNNLTGSPTRSPRSIHNYARRYETQGRHYWNQEGTYPDIAIFYYASASLEPKSIARKMQIQTQVPAGGSSHNFTLDQLMARFKADQSLSRDLKDEIKPIIDAHDRCMARKMVHSETSVHIQSAIDALNNALNLAKK